MIGFSNDASEFGLVLFNKRLEEIRVMEILISGPEAEVLCKRGKYAKWGESQRHEEFDMNSIMFYNNKNGYPWLHTVVGPFDQKRSRDFVSEELSTFIESWPQEAADHYEVKTITLPARSIMDLLDELLPDQEWPCDFTDVTDLTVVTHMLVTPKVRGWVAIGKNEGVTFVPVMRLDDARKDKCRVYRTEKQHPVVCTAKCGPIKFNDIVVEPIFGSSTFVHVINNGTAVTTAVKELGVTYSAITKNVDVTFAMAK